MVKKEVKESKDRVVKKIDHDALAKILIETPIPREKFTLIHDWLVKLIDAVRTIEDSIDINPNNELKIMGAKESIDTILKISKTLDQISGNLKQFSLPRKKYFKNPKWEFYYPQTGENELRNRLATALTNIFTSEFLHQDKINLVNFIKLQRLPGNRPPLREQIRETNKIDFREEEFRDAIKKHADEITAKILNQLSNALKDAATDLAPQRKRGGAKYNPLHETILVNLMKLWDEIFEGKKPIYIKPTNPFVSFAENICTLLKVPSYSTEHHLKEALKIWNASQGRKLAPRKSKLSPKTE